MTAQCPSGGPSAQKPLFGLSVDMTGPALAARFANNPTWISVFIAAAIGGMSWSLATFCTIDPPADVTFTGQDFVDLLGGIGAPTYGPAQQKLIQWINHRMWWDFCYCTAGTTPAVPTAPAAPAGLPALNQNASGGASGPTVACYHELPTTRALTVGTLSHDNIDMEIPALGGGWTGPEPYWVRVVGGRNVVGVGPHEIGTYNFIFNDFGGTPFTTYGPYHSPPGFDVMLPVPLSRSPNQAWYPTFQVSLTTPNATTDTDTLEIFAYCTPTAPTGLGGSPCCPPDPFLSLQVSQILQAVTLIQRQAVPFGYIASTVHAGLTGAGTFAITGLIGLAVSITTDSPHLGVAGTSPAELFDRGYVTFATASGAMHSVRLEHAAQLIIPPAAAVFTTVFYDLNPLITVSITELVREP
jgi:hypothetical protein